MGLPSQSAGREEPVSSLVETDFPQPISAVTSNGIELLHGIRDRNPLLGVSPGGRAVENHARLPPFIKLAQIANPSSN
jgi:hypothetical protein